MQRPLWSVLRRVRLVLIAALLLTLLPALPSARAQDTVCPFRGYTVNQSADTSAVVPAGRRVAVLEMNGENVHKVYHATTTGDTTFSFTTNATTGKLQGVQGRCAGEDDFEAQFTAIEYAEQEMNRAREEDNSRWVFLDNQLLYPVDERRVELSLSTPAVITLGEPVDIWIFCEKSTICQVLFGDGNAANAFYREEHTLIRHFYTQPGIYQIDLRNSSDKGPNDRTTPLEVIVLAPEAPSPTFTSTPTATPSGEPTATPTSTPSTTPTMTTTGTVTTTATTGPGPDPSPTSTPTATATTAPEPGTPSLTLSYSPNKLVSGKDVAFRINAGEGTRPVNTQLCYGDGVCSHVFTLQPGSTITLIHRYNIWRNMLTQQGCDPRPYTVTLEGGPTTTIFVDIDMCVVRLPLVHR